MGKSPRLHWYVITPIVCMSIEISGIRIGISDVHEVITMFWIIPHAIYIAHDDIHALKFLPIDFDNKFYYVRLSTEHLTKQSE